MTKIEYEYMANLLEKRGVNPCIVSEFVLRDDKPNVFIRHDADIYPYKLVPLVKSDMYHLLKSSNYIFWNAPTSYIYNLNVDIPFFREIYGYGLEVGYHVWCPRPFNPMTSAQLTIGQITKLSNYFDINSYSIHDNDLRKEVMTIFNSNNTIKEVKCWSETVFNTGKLMGHMMDSEEGFNFVTPDQDMIDAINSSKKLNSKVKAFIESMKDGMVYGIVTQSQFWNNDGTIDTKKRIFKNNEENQ